MEYLDKFFEIYLARARRELTNASLTDAWYLAFGRAWRTLAFPVIAAIGCGVVFYPLIAGDVLPAVPKGGWQAIAAVVGLVSVLWTMLRWRLFLSSPPSLANVESEEEKYFVLKFRRISIGSVLVVAVIATIHGLTR